MEKKPLLQDIGRKMRIKAKGDAHIENPSLIVANHTSLLDIFAVPYVLSEACQVVMSSRLMWKRDTEEHKARRRLIEQTLYGIPLEVHGGQSKMAGLCWFFRRVHTLASTALQKGERARLGCS